MAEIHVAQLSEHCFEVRVQDASQHTTHEVTLRESDLERYAGGLCDAETLIVASFEFLLEREPAASILRRFELPVIERYFPEYPERIRERLG